MPSIPKAFPKPSDKPPAESPPFAAEPIPASVGDHLGNAGPLVTIDWINPGDGKPRRYKIAQPTAITLARMEMAIAKDAFDELEALGKDGSLLVASRHHRCGGPLWDAVMEDGIRWTPLMLWAMLCDSHPDFERKDAVRMMRDKAKEVKFATAYGAPFFYLAAAEIYGVAVEDPPTPDSPPNG